MKKTYVMAVSGGVDSMMLLHKLSAVQPPSIRYVVAHFDHGMRAVSTDDAAFVQEAAAQAGHVFELGNGDLGAGASEEQARNARYDFLHKVAKKHKAEAIITAHHQHDVLETMCINLIRGTGVRGLVGFTQSGILRPLINTPKKEILAYAKQHELTWREDETNNDTSYLRNQLRHGALKSLTKDQRQKLLSCRQHAQPIVQEMDNLTEKLLVRSMKNAELVRSRYVILPFAVRCEMIAAWLRLQGISYDHKTIQRLALACAVGSPGTQHVIDKDYALYCAARTISLKSRSP